MNTRSQRGLLWTSLILGSIYGLSYVFLVGFFPPPPATLSELQVVDLYTQHNLQLRIGVVLMLLTGAFCMPWAVVVSQQMARYEKGFPLWAFLQGLAGTIGALLFVLPVVFWGAAAFSVDRAPALTLLTHEIGWLFFVSPVAFFPFQLIPTAVISFSRSPQEAKDSAFPRWIGFLTLWTSVTAIGGLFSQIFKTGPFAWNGLITFYLAFIVFGTWMGALAYTLLRAIRVQDQSGMA